MYLSPGLAPPTYTPPPSPRSYPQRHRGAARRSLCHSFRSRTASIPPPTFCFRLSSSFRCWFKPPRASPSHAPIRTTTVRNTHARSLHAAFTFPCVLTHVYFSPHSSPFSSTPSCAWRRFTVAFIGHQTHTNDAASKPRRIVASRRVASRRVASCRVGSSRSHRLLH